VQQFRARSVSDRLMDNAGKIVHLYSGDRWSMQQVKVPDSTTRRVYSDRVGNFRCLSKTVHETSVCRVNVWRVNVIMNTV
jgi:hypothetical protein